MKKAAGFTLVELIVIIVIAAALAAIAAPSFSGMLASNRLTAQTNELIAGLNTARSEAIKLNGTVTLCRVSGPAATSCAGNGTWTDWAVLHGTRVILRGALNSNVRASDISLTGSSIQFSPTGLAMSGDAVTNNSQIVVCTSSRSDSNVRNIAVGPGSRISTTTATGACS